MFRLSEQDNQSERKDKGETEMGNVIEYSYFFVEFEGCDVMKAMTKVQEVLGNSASVQSGSQCGSGGCVFFYAWEEVDTEAIEKTIWELNGGLYCNVQEAAEEEVEEMI
jgi:hypothetical protein